MRYCGVSVGVVGFYCAPMVYLHTFSHFGLYYAHFCPKIFGQTWLEDCGKKWHFWGQEISLPRYLVQPLDPKNWEQCGRLHCLKLFLSLCPCHGSPLREEYSSPSHWLWSWPCDSLANWMWAEVTACQFWANAICSTTYFYLLLLHVCHLPWDQWETHTQQTWTDLKSEAEAELSQPTTDLWTKCEYLL